MRHSLRPFLRQGLESGDLLRESASARSTTEVRANKKATILVPSGIRARDVSWT